MSVPGLVSIILPTYNRADLLPQAIESVLRQTFTNWELIIWNDGSTDNTAEVANSFTDPRISVYSEPNRGMSYGLNQGFARAQGEWIAFLDDDDEWLPIKLAWQVSFLITHPGVSLAFGDFINVDKSSGKSNSGFAQCVTGLRILSTINIETGWYIIDQFFLEGICRENFIAFDTSMMRKDIFSVIGTFNESIKRSMDLELWWRVGLAGLKVAYTTETLMVRNKYNGSLSSGGELSLLRALAALDVLAEDTTLSGKEEYKPLLRSLYRNSWQNLIGAYGEEGKKSEAVHAFFRSLRYGLRLGSVRLLLEALIGIN